MKISTATALVAEPGPLARIVIKWTEMMESRARAGGSTAADWEPFAEFVAVDDFVRVGAYQEVMTWGEMVKFLTEWAGATRFETTVFHITEVGRTVFQEIEERHYRGEDFIRKNVMAVYRFDEQDRICHLDIYEQAKDIGGWIVEAAKGAVDTGAAQ